jgi:hypothetical protein
MTTPPVTPAPDAPSRRKLLQGAAVTGAFVALAAGKPVFGSQTLCSPSGFHSGNLSGIEPEPCNGKSPGFWKKHPGAWEGTGVCPGFCKLGSNDVCMRNSPLQYTKPNGGSASKFRDVFPTGTPYDDMYIMQYMREFHPMDPLPTKPMVWHLVAAYLNAASGIPGYVLTTDEILDMWHQLIVLGQNYYTSPSGLVIAWGGDDGLEDFLNATYGDGVLV